MANLYLKELFKKASAKLKYPSIQVEEHGKAVRFKLATKGYIGITVEGEYVGKIDQAGTLVLYKDKELVGDVLYKIDTQGASYFTGQGKAMGRCCFCGTKIESEESLVHGYGPICAENFGLPWGEASKEQKEAMKEAAIKEAFSIDDLEQMAAGISGDETEAEEGDSQDQELKDLEEKDLEEKDGPRVLVDGLVQAAQIRVLEELKLNMKLALEAKHLTLAGYMGAIKIVDQMLNSIKQ